MKPIRFRPDAVKEAQARALTEGLAVFEADKVRAKASLALNERALELSEDWDKFMTTGGTAPLEPLRAAVEAARAAYRVCVGNARLAQSAVLVLQKAAWAVALLDLERGDKGLVDAAHAHDMSKLGFIQYSGGGSPELSPFGQELAALLHDYMEGNDGNT